MLDSVEGGKIRYIVNLISLCYSSLWMVRVNSPMRRRSIDMSCSVIEKMVKV